MKAGVVWCYYYFILKDYQICTYDLTKIFQI